MVYVEGVAEEGSAILLLQDCMRSPFAIFILAEVVDLKVSLFPEPSPQSTFAV